MTIDQPRVALLSLRDIDPLLRDGASKTLIKRLKIIQSYGCRVSLVNFLPDEEYNRYALARIKRLGTDVPGPEPEGVSRVQIGGVDAWHELLPYRFDQLGEASPHILDKFFHKLAECQPDFVLTCGDSLYPLTAAYLRRVPGAHSFHSLANIERCARDAFHPILLRRRLVFTASAYLQSQVQKQLGCESVVWHPHPSLNVSKPRCVAETPPSNDLFSVGFVAGGWIKGDHLVERIAEQLPQYTFLIAGRGWQASPSQKPGNLHFFGWVADMDHFYRQIRLLVVPSMVPEGFPRVILEGAAHGLPIIANRVGGIPEAMGGSGVLMDAALSSETDLNPLAAQYARVIDRILTDPALYQRYQEKARQRVLDFQTQQQAATQKIIQDFILGGKPRQAAH